MLDESLGILTEAWSGAPVRHEREHFTVDDVEFLPQPVQQPRVPVWVGGLAGRSKPLRRAARYDGYVPVNLTHPDQLAEAVATIHTIRDTITPEPYDIVVGLPPDRDPHPFAKAGATWWLTEFDPELLALDLVRGVIRDGPADT
jgi:alkanesulfonate monooxygenase SsuD/methylene tetrahydromethanopterin reductase-like flavin-dependent oxidoreductase (luciferase family)